MTDLMNYDKIAKNYDERYKSDMSERENEAVGVILDAMLYRHNRLTPSVIDVGCGTGFAIDIATHISPKSYLGVDISGGMIEQAKKKHPEYEFVQSNICDLSTIENDSYWFALSLFSIPYIGVDSVQRVYDLLHYGGCYITVIYNKPYKNRDSVYWRKKKHYLNDVKPLVDEMLKKLTETFQDYQIYYLTPDETYLLAVFRKGKVNNG